MNINIGLLLPTSTIFPISKNFEKGLNQGINFYKESNLEIEVTKAFIGQGSVKQIEEACNKFFTYDDVDVVTGFISNKVADAISNKFPSRNIPLLINNLGCYLPNFSGLNDHLFINNSLKLWQHAWSVGHWGVKTFGKRGMFVSSVYDAAYSFSHMFHEGMQAADTESLWSFSVPPMPQNGELSNMSVIFPFLEKYTPDFVFATFCGAETTVFLNEFIKRGWHKRTALIGLPFLLTPFEPLIDDITIYTTSSSEENEINDPFYSLGYESGRMIVQAAVRSDGTNLNSQLQNLQKSESESSSIWLIENTIKASEKDHKKKILQEYQTLDKEELKEQGSPFGWENPYLCI